MQGLGEIIDRKSKENFSFCLNCVETKISRETLKFNGVCMKIISSCPFIIQGQITVPDYGRETFDITWARKHDVQAHQLKQRPMET